MWLAGWICAPSKCLLVITLLESILSTLRCVSIAHGGQNMHDVILTPIVLDIDGSDTYSIGTFWNMRGKFGYANIRDPEVCNCTQIWESHPNLANLIKIDFGYLTVLPFVTVEGYRFAGLGVFNGFITVSCVLESGQLRATEYYNLSLNSAPRFAPKLANVPAKLVTDGRRPYIFLENEQLNVPDIVCQSSEFNCTVNQIMSPVKKISFKMHPSETGVSLIPLNTNSFLTVSLSQMIGKQRETKFTTFEVLDKMEFHKQTEEEVFLAKAKSGDFLDLDYIHTIVITLDGDVRYLLHCLTNSRHQYTNLVLQYPGKKLWEFSYIRLGFVISRCYVDFLPLASQDSKSYLVCINSENTQFYVYRIGLFPLMLQDLVTGHSLCMSETITTGLFLDLRNPDTVAFLPNEPFISPLDWTHSIITGRAKPMATSKEFNMTVSIYLPVMDITILMYCTKNNSMPPPQMTYLRAYYILHGAYKGNRSVLQTLDKYHFFYDSNIGLYSSSSSPTEIVYYQEQPQTPLKLFKSVYFEKQALLLLFGQSLTNTSLFLTVHRLEIERRPSSRTYFHRVISPVAVLDVTVLQINSTVLRVVMWLNKETANSEESPVGQIAYFELFLDYPRVQIEPFPPKPEGTSETISISLNSAFHIRMRVEYGDWNNTVVNTSVSDGCMLLAKHPSGLTLNLDPFLKIDGHISRWGVHKHPIPPISETQPVITAGLNTMQPKGELKLPLPCVRVIKINTSFIACIDSSVMVHFYKIIDAKNVKHFLTADLTLSSSFFENFQKVTIHIADIAIAFARNTIFVFWHSKKPNEAFGIIPKFGIIDLDDLETGFQMSLKGLELPGAQSADRDACFECEPRAVVEPLETAVMHIIPLKQNLYIIRFQIPPSGTIIPNWLKSSEFQIVNSFTPVIPANLVSFDIRCSVYFCLGGFFDSEGSWYFKLTRVNCTDGPGVLSKLTVGYTSWQAPIAKTPLASMLMEQKTLDLNLTSCPEEAGLSAVFKFSIAYQVNSVETKILELCILSPPPEDYKEGEYTRLILRRPTPNYPFEMLASYKLPLQLKLRQMRCFKNHIMLVSQPVSEVDYYAIIYIFEVERYQVVQEFEISYQETYSLETYSAENLALISIYFADDKVVSFYELAMQQSIILSPSVTLPVSLRITVHPSRHSPSSQQPSKLVLQLTAGQSTNSSPDSTAIPSDNKPSLASGQRVCLKWEKSPSSKR